jgi:MFS family permease
MKPIFVVTALFYGFFILLMCWRVKEGEYPPPIKEAKGRWWSGIQNYAQECYGHSYYWWVFLTYSALLWGSASGTVAIFFYRDELGFSLDLFGKTAAWGQLLFIILAYPIGVLMDRWGCHKMLIVGTSLVCGVSLAMFFFAVNQKSTICWTIALSLSSALSSMALAKWTIEVYPRDRYGQFGSAGGLFSSLGGMIAALAFAWWIDWIKDYRYFLIWNAIFAAVCFVSSNVVYRRWKAFGGLTHYSPP